MVDENDWIVDRLAVLFEKPVAAVRRGEENRPNGFLDVLDAVRPEVAFDLRQAFRALKQVVAFAQTPIIGICGLVNSGKSSTTAFHLSDSGKRRVNIGDTSSEGTHRFVLWMPKKRSNDRALIAMLLKSIFPGEVEYLSEEPNSAAKQYNSHKDFAIPLIAFDHGLDDHGFGILDCPDIQRRHDEQRPEETALVRRNALAQATRLCSAFHVVTSVEQQASGELGTLMEVLGGSDVQVPIYYVLTKVHGETRRYVDEAKKRLSEIGVAHRVRAIFVSPWVQGRPARGFPEGMRIHDGRNEQIDLKSFIESLDAAKLQSGYLAARVGEVSWRCLTGVSELKDHVRANEVVSSQVRSVLLDFLERQFLDGDGSIRHLLTPELLSEVKESIHRTSPWYFKPGTAGTKAVSWVSTQVAEWIPRVRVPVAPAEEPKDLLHDTRSEDFCNYMLGRRWLPARISDADLRAVWDRVVALHIETSEALVRGSKDRDELDRETQKLWDDLPMGRKATAVMLMPVAVLGGRLRPLQCRSIWVRQPSFIRRPWPSCLRFWGSVEPRL